MKTADRTSLAPTRDVRAPSLAERLAHSYRYPPGTDAEMSQAFQLTISAEQLASIPKFRADEPYRFMSLQPIGTECRFSDLPPMHLPFPAMWIETTVPQSGPQIQEVGEVPKERGWYLEECPLDGEHASEIRNALSQDCSANSVITICGVQRFQSGPPMVDMFVRLVGLADDGTIIGLANILSPSGRYEAERLDPNIVEKIQELHDASPRNHYVPLWILGLIQAKNVLKEPDRRRLNPNRMKSKTPYCEYRHSTIKLPHPSSGGGKGRKTGEIPLHLVRGHFKTYTADAPLFGKTTGTYWWSHFVAGNPSRGMRTADYEIDLVEGI